MIQFIIVNLSARLIRNRTKILNRACHAFLSVRFSNSSKQDLNMTTRCEIRFKDNPLGIYYAGQTIQGTVELHLARPKTVQGVFISFDGFAYTTWTETKTVQRHGKSESRTVRYRGRETYLNSKTYMKRAEDGRSSFELVPGTHVFDFLCVLPTNLPSSYEGE